MGDYLNREILWGLKCFCYGGRYKYMFLKTANDPQKHTHLNFQIKSLFVVCLLYISVNPIKYNSDVWRITDCRQLVVI